MHDVSWEQYELLLAMRGENAVPRMAYLKGELEILSPSLDHEGLKKCLARLLEAYTEEMGIYLEGYGSWTVKRKREKRGLEPDECHVVGREPKDRPDLALEVAWTKGGIDKLEIYRGLGIAEVWIWRKGVIHVFRLEGRRYQEASASRWLPGLDLARFARFVRARGQPDAARALRAALRRRRAR